MGGTFWSVGGPGNLVTVAIRREFLVPGEVTRTGIFLPSNYMRVCVCCVPARVHRVDGMG